jgi:hypothetical protein
MLSTLYTDLPLNVSNDGIANLPITGITLGDNMRITPFGISHMNIKKLKVLGNPIRYDHFLMKFSLIELHLVRNHTITDVGLSYLPTLEKLVLFNNLYITNVGLSKLPNLNYLILYGDHSITDAGICSLPSLTGLEIHLDTRITGNGPQFAKLNTLELYNVDTFTDDAIMMMLSITKLSLVNTNTSKYAILHLPLTYLYITGHDFYLTEIERYSIKTLKSLHINYIRYL